MTSLGRLIFFDQPGFSASDPVTPGALPTLEQWAGCITAVLDDLGSREAALLVPVGALPTGRFGVVAPSQSPHTVRRRPAGVRAARIRSPASRVSKVSRHSLVRRLSARSRSSVFAMERLTEPE
jgi:pimeloyl-ACP methyl ester carboxylesterase